MDHLVQARGGCACAGPYAQTLLGMSMELAAEYEDILKGGLPLSDIRTEGGGGTEMQHIQSEGEGVKKSQNSVDVTYGGPHRTTTA